MAEKAKRPGRKRKDPLKVKRDKAGRILNSVRRSGGEGTRQAQAQRFRQLGAKGVLDPRLGSTLGLMFVLHVPVRIGAQEYDAACWLSDRLKALDDIVLDLRRSPPSSSIERGTGGSREDALSLVAGGVGDEVTVAAAEVKRTQAQAIKDQIDTARKAMGGGMLGRLRWEALTACCRDEGMPTEDKLRHAVEAMVELAWAGGFYDARRRKSKNLRQPWGHDERAVEIIRVVKGEEPSNGKS